MASRQETLRNIRNSWKVETGEDVGMTGASILLDGMCDAFRERAEAVSIQHAVLLDRDTAEYLKWVWTGTAGRALRDAIDRVDAKQADPDRVGEMTR